MEKIYLIQVSGIKCTNCAGKIQRTLKEFNNQGLLKSSVNIIKQKISVTLKNDILIPLILEKLQQIGFPAIGQPTLISQGNSSQRSFGLLIQNPEQIVNSVNIIQKLVGIIKCPTQQQDNLNIIDLTYNSDILKGREIANALLSANIKFSIINKKVQSFKNHNYIQSEGIKWKYTLILISFLMVFNMVLPMSGSWSDKFYGFPETFGMVPFSVIINIGLALYVLKTYGKRYIQNAYKNYFEFGQTNMETLIALGTVSSLFLSLFWILTYTRQSINHTMKNRIMGIHDINDSLTSASIIVLVVSLGKYLQFKIKKKIQKITQELYPESALFNQMNVEFVELKNRRLMISSKQIYDVTLIQKGDILDLKPGRLLLDVVILDGQIKATQSALDGSEEVSVLTKGERIQSGSIIHENIGSLVEVENVFQKSLLLQIGMQIKLSQNIEDQKKSGIQSVCKRIARYFVKTVVFLSIFVMVTWTIILAYGYAQVPIHQLCWVIQRGISVVVASCPCALGLAVPTVIAIILNLATKNGILIRNNGVFESMKKCQIVAFDKTGTLFTKIKKIEDVTILSKNMNFEQNQMWEIIALVEKQIQHPIAEVLYKEAFVKSKITGTNYNYILVDKPKLNKDGLTAKVRSKSTNTDINANIGNKKLMQQFNISIPTYTKNINSATELFLSLNNQVCMVIYLNTHSNLRPQAQEVVKLIRGFGNEVHILSGDSKQSVKKLGQYLGIPNECLHAEYSAFMKMEWIKQTQKSKGVLMVGDGLNDIPCLQQASIGVSINSKSQLNINAANVVILSQNLYKIVTFLKLVRRGNLFIKINLFWAFAYNVVMMPVVAGLFYFFNIYTSPMWSSIAMSCSSIMVVLFANLLPCFSYDESVINKKDNLKQVNNENNFKSITERPFTSLSEEQDVMDLKDTAYQFRHQY